MTPMQKLKAARKTGTRHGRGTRHNRRGASRPAEAPQPLPPKDAVENLNKALASGALLPKPPPWVKISDTLIMATAVKPSDQRRVREAMHGTTAFTLPAIAPHVLPRGQKGMANDAQVIEINAWAANQVYNGAYYNGVAFMGYTALAELAQISEYRRISEVTATEMTRKWISLKGPKKRVKELKDEMTRLDVQGKFRKEVELDGFFGRGHLYIDTGDTEKPTELKTSIGNGRDATSLLKFKGKKGFLKALQTVEPVWCYPAKYTSNNPLKQDWYNPQTWFSMGTEIHVSRFITFVGREVPDMLKPSYSFGGLSLSQMAKPYIDNWLRTRQAVADLIWSFSVNGLECDLATLSAEGGSELLKRAALFANLKTNQGLMLTNFGTEKFFNVSTSLSTLDALQSQAQEHMCSVIGIPVVKLLGIQPAGLNASSEGELTTWYDWIAAFQEKFFSKPLGTIIDLCMLNLWGEIDDGITWEFEPMHEMTEKEHGELNKNNADADVALVGAGILDPMEVRQRLANDPTSGYEGLDVEDVPINADPDEDDPSLEETPEALKGLMDRDDDQRRETGREDDEGRQPGGRPRDKRQPRGSRAREPREAASAR